jgi:hypothetical protein
MSDQIHTLNKDHVQLGLWTNWSRGPVGGLTLTLAQKHGALLTAFLALLITFTGGRFWKILRILIHQHLSSSEPEDAIYHQRQVILRNTETSSSAFVEFLCVCWAWRHTRGVKAFRRNAAVIFLSATTTIAFMTASILSTQLSNAMGDEVLVSSPSCGEELAYNHDKQKIPDRETLHRRRHVLNQNYADGCYGNDMMGMQCNLFRKQRLAYFQQHNLPCPFPGGDRICKTTNGALRLQTEYINSNDDLGLNSRPEARHEWRTRIDCSPLKTEGYTTTGTQLLPDNTTSRELISYLYGNGTRYLNATWQKTLRKPNFEKHSVTDTSYTLEVMSFLRDFDGKVSKNANFRPIADLDAPDADGSIIFLSSNDIPFLGEVDDPLFSAHVYSGFNVSLNVNRHLKMNITQRLYYRDEPAQVIACSQQWQVCNPNLPKDTGCTKFSSGRQTKRLAKPLWTNDEQRAIFNWTHNAPTFISAANWVNQVSMLAYKTLSPGQFQGPLPDNQWKLELEHWFHHGLATAQRNNVERATGYEYPAFKQFFRSPLYDGEKAACKIQVVRSSAYTSFSVLGFSIVIACAVMIIVTSLALPIIVERSARRTKVQANPKLLHKRLEWTTNSVLQLQRLAHEGAGSSSWTAIDTVYPITIPDEKLALLDVTDYKHPKLSLYGSDLK